jgi:non-canonical purine NTP pyrophosphatase (RdgB/HAM1 family)
VSAGRWRTLSGRVVVATGNPGKVREIRAILAGLPFELTGLAEYPPVEFPAEGDEYAHNAAVKAETAAAATGCPALADDSGLEVVGLGGGPGPYSARYGGSGLDDRSRVQHLLSELGARPHADRSARFVCLAALARPGKETVVVRGECVGRILEVPRGVSGFGYDPVFAVESGERSMAQIPEDEKNRISHRARAFRALLGLDPSPLS